MYLIAYVVGPWLWGGERGAVRDGRTVPFFYSWILIYLDSLIYNIT